jgi:hypothetical protein
MLTSEPVRMTPRLDGQATISVMNGENSLLSVITRIGGQRPNPMKKYVLVAFVLASIGLVASCEPSKSDSAKSTFGASTASTTSTSKPAPPATTAPTTTTTSPRPTTTNAPTTTTTLFTAPSAPSSGCDPNYTPCVPIASDVDCAGGSGNGPAYVRGPVQVIGRDIYGLDRDGDGVGCE